MSIKFGLDVSQGTLDLAYADSVDSAVFIATFPNQLDAFPNIAKAIKEITCQHGDCGVEVILEPTGGYEKPFLYWGEQQDWRLFLPNPKRVRDWIHGKGQRSKTDQLDAKMLARYGWETKVFAWKPLPANWQELRDLLSLQEDYKGKIRRVENQLHALNAQGKPSKVALKVLQQEERCLQKQLDYIEKQIKKIMKEDKELGDKCKLLQTCPAVGDVLGPELSAFLMDWYVKTDGQGSGKGLTAMTGLDPEIYQSGESVRKKTRISKKGNKRMRSLLFAAARGGITAKDSPLRDYYDRMRARGLGYKQAIVACSRKILCWCWAIFRSHSPFAPSKAASH